MTKILTDRRNSVLTENKIIGDSKVYTIIILRSQILGLGIVVF